MTMDLKAMSAKDFESLSGEVAQETIRRELETAGYLVRWICPRCRKVHAPSVLGCDCPKEVA